MAFVERSINSQIWLPSPLDVWGSVKRLITARRARLELTKLLEKEDHLLQDLGVLRSEVRQALSSKGNPAFNLRALVAKRRHQNRLKV